MSGFGRAKERLDAADARGTPPDRRGARWGPGGETLPDWRLHDLRRTAASGMARLGVACTSSRSSLTTPAVRSAASRRSKPALLRGRDAVGGAGLVELARRASRAPEQRRGAGRGAVMARQRTRGRRTIDDSDRLAFMSEPAKRAASPSLRPRRMRSSLTRASPGCVPDTCPSVQGRLERKYRVRQRVLERDATIRRLVWQVRSGGFGFNFLTPDPRGT